MFTVQAFRATLSSTPTPGTNPDKHHWSGEHVVNHHRVTVSVRADRKPLVAIHEQKCQICMVHVDSFKGDYKSQVQQAFNFMVELAMAYTQDRLQKDELLNERGSRLESLGLDRPRKGRRAALKRPAASPGSVTGSVAGSVARPLAKKPRKPRMAIKRKPAAAEEPCFVIVCFFAGTV